jgi:hypothetical protein
VRCVPRFGNLHPSLREEHPSTPLSASKATQSPPNPKPFTDGDDQFPAKPYRVSEFTMGCSAPYLDTRFEMQIMTCFESLPSLNHTHSLRASSADVN